MPRKVQPVEQEIRTQRGRKQRPTDPHTHTPSRQERDRVGRTALLVWSSAPPTTGYRSTTLGWALEYLRNHSSHKGLDENPDGQVLVKKCGASDDRLPEYTRRLEDGAELENTSAADSTIDEGELVDEKKTPEEGTEDDPRR